RPSGRLRVTLPAAASVPGSIASSAVRVNGSRAGKVSVTGHAVTVVAAAPKGVTCDSIVQGKMTVAFTAAARLAHPAEAGSYSIGILRGQSSYTVTVKISA